MSIFRAREGHETCGCDCHEAVAGVVSAPKDVLRIVFDTAIGSLDFGSGFLDDEEVTALRTMAGLLGVDPNEATPYNFRAKYPHPYDPHRCTSSIYTGCVLPASDPIHSVA